MGAQSLWLAAGSKEKLRAYTQWSPKRVTQTVSTCGDTPETTVVTVHERPFEPMDRLRGPRHILVTPSPRLVLPPGFRCPWRLHRLTGGAPSSPGTRPS